MCEFTERCWRHSYSRYYCERLKFQVPPDRQTLFLEGYAKIEMLPKSGVYCENMPGAGAEQNLCPFYAKFSTWQECHERKKELRKQEKHKEIKFPNKEKRLRLPVELRRRVAANFNHKCAYCERAHNQKTTTGKVQTVVDHIRPLALGGDPLSSENLCLACKDCNRAKGTEIWSFGCRKGYYV